MYVSDRLLASLATLIGLAAMNDVNQEHSQEIADIVRLRQSLIQNQEHQFNGGVASNVSLRHLSGANV